MEYNTPKIGVLAAVEKVNFRIHADKFMKMNARGGIADCVIPGTFEMEALAKSVTRVIRGEEKANLYKIRNQHQHDILRKEEEA